MDAEGWRNAMRDWALPDVILAGAPESPWGFPVELFRSRAELATPGHLTFSHRRARDALPADGTVLDVGVGAGAASLPLHPPCSLIIGVDSSADQLSEFRRQASRAGATVRTITGEWPAMSTRTPVVDVVVCNHVAYNVADLAPFALALTAHARRRVVMEVTSRHPAAWMADLWWQFHALRRPVRPDARDIVSVLRSLGLGIHRHAEVTPRRAGGFEHREDAVAWIRRRLCLDASRDADVATALGERLVHDGAYWSAGSPAEPVVTIWWDVRRESAE
ncbi:MAG: class I SAM-dependent methyltransferase [Candidatus Dormibacteria bacterium]